MFSWNSLAFSMVAIWSLIPLPFLKPSWTSGSSRFTYCWSLAWRILSITLLVCAAAAKLLQYCPTLCDPRTAAHQAPPSLGFSKQEHQSGLPFPPPMHESEKWKWSHLVMSNSLRPLGLCVRWVQLCGSLSILCHCLSLWLEWKLTFSSPVATAEFSKFAGILSAALSQHHLSGFEIAQLEFYHLH